MIYSVKKDPIGTISRHQGAKFNPIICYYTDSR